MASDSEDDRFANDFEDEDGSEGRLDEEEDEREDAAAAAAVAAVDPSAGKRRRTGNKPKKVKEPKAKDLIGDPEALAAYNAKVAKRGIVYFSKIPPFMKPVKLKHLMSMYGEVGKVFLKKEDDAVYKKRRRHGGNKKPKYVEGWVEFEDKKVARAVAASRNGQPVGGKKSSYYHDDLWCMLYLPKFKWHNLTERVAYENAVRQKKLDAEDAQVRRETNIYVEQVAKAKSTERRIKKAAKAAGEGGAGARAQPQGDPAKQIDRKIKQRKPISEGEAAPKRKKKKSTKAAAE